MLYRMGRWAAAHGKLVLVAWVAVLLLLGGLMQRFGGHVTDQFSLPGAESQVAADLLEERFPAIGRSSATVVVAADDLRAHAGEIAALKRQIGAILAETQAGATEIVRSAPGAGSLSMDQIAGIGIGIVAGALIADALGGSGIVVAAVATGGGMLGNWIAGEL